MKYLKLFEDFGGEDPKWIVTSALAFSDPTTAAQY